MGEFSTKVLTTWGRFAVATALSGNRLTYSAINASSRAMTEDEARVARRTDFDIDTTEIISVVAQDSVCRVVATIRNESSGSVIIRSLGLIGRLESVSSMECIAVQSDPTGLILAPAGSAGDTAQVGFNLFVSSDDAVVAQVTDAGSATLADLDRFVSLHLVGQPSVGGAQTVRGEKTFADPVRIGKSVLPAAEGDPPYIGSAAEPFAFVNADVVNAGSVGAHEVTAAEVSADAITAGSILPDAGGCNIGSQTSPMRSVHAGEGRFNILSANTISGLNDHQVPGDGSGLRVPGIGGIVMIVVKVDASVSTQTFWVGNRVGANTARYTIAPAKYTSSGWTAGNDGAVWSEFKFVLLSMFERPSSALTAWYPALAIRIE